MLARVRAKVRRANVDSSLQPLTRLPGNIAIEHEVRRRFEAREPWAVIYADLDNFKAFNDHYGFVRGDDAIRLVATTMSDTIKRIGDESEISRSHRRRRLHHRHDPARAEHLARSVAETFDRDVLALYDPRIAPRLDRARRPARQQRAVSR